MKKTYTIFFLKTKEVCTPSDDYYRRREDWFADEIPTLASESSFDTEEEAINNIKELGPGDYIVLPVYSIPK